MKKKKLLLVEDDELMRTLYRDLLSEEFIVDVAVDGEEAYSKLSNSMPDHVIMDMFLPKRNGTDVVLQLEKDGTANLQKKVVFLTNTDAAVLKDVQKRGYRCLIKSDLTPDEFLRKIKQLL